ncbi:MAG TPA: ribosome assembly RNA-binding protein YhbY [Methylomirabilota bacterium]|jgi:RNA-binding protein|nr:ribosome assembly RNA-binding protein YhbY [Methylomirabilota bacterium]
MRDLTGKQRRHLRALGQRLTATLHVGHEGVSDAVVAQADAQLEAHELIKVRVSENAPDDRHATAEDLAARTRAHLAQVIGRTALLYRRRQEEPVIVLPASSER